MSNQNPIRDKLLRSLDAAFEKSPWHSLKAALEDLTEEEARWEPERFAGFPWSKGSIRDIVFHVAADMLVQHSTAFGDESLDWSRAQQLPEARAGTLEASLRLLHQAKEQIRRTLEGLSDEDLNRKVSIWGGRKLRVEQFFDMLIEHALYHAGQIRYIRCSIAAKASENRKGPET